MDGFPKQKSIFPLPELAYLKVSGWQGVSWDARSLLLRMRVNTRYYQDSFFFLVDLSGSIWVPGGSSCGYIEFHHPKPSIFPRIAILEWGDLQHQLIDQNVIPSWTDARSGIKTNHNKAQKYKTYITTSWCFLWWWFRCENQHLLHSHDGFFSMGRKVISMTHVGRCTIHASYRNISLNTTMQIHICRCPICLRGLTKKNTWPNKMRKIQPNTKWEVPYTKYHLDFSSARVGISLHGYTSWPNIGSLNLHIPKGLPLGS